MSSSDLADAGILRYTITPEIHTIDELKILQRLANCFEFELNDISLDVYKKLYSFKKKKNE